MATIPKQPPSMAQPGSGIQPGPGDAGTFIAQLAQATGLDPKVIAAWVQVEGAYAPNGTGHYNFLNLRAKSPAQGYSGVALAGQSTNGFAQFLSVQDAVQETAYWINHFGNYAGIRASTKLGPKSQIAAIAASPWDAGHYNGGRSLLSAYSSLTSKGSSWLSSITHAVGKGLVDAGTGNPLGAGLDVAKGLGLGGIPGVSQADAIAQIPGETLHVLKWVMDPTNWLRVGYVLAGSLAVGAGLVLMAKSVGTSVAMPKMPSGGGGGSEYEEEGRAHAEHLRREARRQARTPITEGEVDKPMVRREPKHDVSRPLRKTKAADDIPF